MERGPYLWIAIILGAVVIFAAGAWAARRKARRDRRGRLRAYTVMHAFSDLQPDEVWRTRLTYDAEDHTGDFVVTVRLLGRRRARLRNAENHAADATSRTVAVPLHRTRDQIDNNAHADVLLFPPPGCRRLRIRVEARRAGEPRPLTARTFQVTRPTQ